MKLHLTKGLFAHISKEDSPLAEYKWTASDCTTTGKQKKIYAVRSEKVESGYVPYRRHVYLHREVMQRIIESDKQAWTFHMLTGSMRVMFKDSNTLNCTRENLVLLAPGFPESEVIAHTGIRRSKKELKK